MTGVPQKDGRSWRRLIEAYHALLSHLLVLSVAILVIPVSLQIFSRFTSLIPHYIWTEEMARFLFIWTIMIGAMIAVRERTHFEVDLIGRLRPKAEAVARLFVAAAMLAFSAVFVWSGIEFTRFAWNRISELAELPLWLIHIAWPITGITSVLFIAEQVHDSLRVLFGKTS